MNNVRRKVMITMGGGGYLWEALRLLDSMGDEFEYAYVTGSDCMVPPMFSGREVYIITTISTKSSPHWWQAFPKLILASMQSLGVIWKAKPDVIVGVAAPLSVPLAVAGKMFRKKVVFIESITRVAHPSLTGRILEKLRLADRIYVQWSGAVNLYKNALYMGSVL
jgi:UDP-N-acetylglucosamine:LPS N-acetylglucosamine transferase